jgi:hypothetical protein
MIHDTQYMSRAGARLRLHDRAPKNVLPYSTPYYWSQSDGGDLLRRILSLRLRVLGPASATVKGSEQVCVYKTEVARNSYQISSLASVIDRKAAISKLRSRETLSLTTTDVTEKHQHIYTVLW